VTLLAQLRHLLAYLHFSPARSLGPEWKQAPLFSLHWIDTLECRTSGYESKAERNPMLLLELERVLFKFK
jgi:hypothetical protein